jgi:hypothetical protein
LAIACLSITYQLTIACLSITYQLTIACLSITFSWPLLVFLSHISWPLLVFLSHISWPLLVFLSHISWPLPVHLITAWDYPFSIIKLFLTLRHDRWYFSYIIIVTLYICIERVVYPSGAPEFTPVFSGVRVTRSLVLCVFCRSFFFWSLYCLFFDIRILIIPLISSNSSQKLLCVIWCH